MGLPGPPWASLGLPGPPCLLGLSGSGSIAYNFRISKLTFSLFLGCPSAVSEGFFFFFFLFFFSFFFSFSFSFSSSFSFSLSLSLSLSFFFFSSRVLKIFFFWPQLPHDFQTKLLCEISFFWAVSGYHPLGFFCPPFFVPHFSHFFHFFMFFHFIIFFFISCFFPFFHFLFFSFFHFFIFFFSLSQGKNNWTGKTRVGGI